MYVPESTRVALAKCLGQQLSDNLKIFFSKQLCRQKSSKFFFRGWFLSHATSPLTFV